MRVVGFKEASSLVAPGSDRAAWKWSQDYRLAGCEPLHLHHLHRAMAWLGEPLADQAAPTRPEHDAIARIALRARDELHSDLREAPDQFLNWPPLARPVVPAAE